MEWVKPDGRNNHACIEVALVDVYSAAPPEVWIKTSDLTPGHALVVTRGEFAAFITAAKAGQYDEIAGF